MFDDDRARLQSLRRGAGSAVRMQHYLQAHPIAAVADMVETLDLSKTAIHSALDHLQKFGIVREMTGKQRYRLYVYDAYLSLLDEGTEPLER